MSEREWLEALVNVDAADALPVLAWLGGQELELDEAELNGAVRRAMLLLATGGDPQRALELDGRTVTALAADLDRPERRTVLVAGLRRLREQAGGLAQLDTLLDRLIADGDLAWRAFAAGLLGEALADDEDDDRPPA